jgi:repressor LexA
MISCGEDTMALTRRQKEILDFIESFLDEHGYSPSFEEIASFFQYRSLATVHEHLTNLESKGYIRKNYNESRSIELARSEMRLAAVELPLLGLVAAGEPIEAIEDTETIPVPEDLISGSTGSHYVLRVRGDSMIDEQIRDGDYVIVQSRMTAHDGEMVIALIDDEGATVKRFYREAGGKVRLQPANAALDPLSYRADRVRIQGIVVGVIRRY